MSEDEAQADKEAKQAAIKAESDFSCTNPPQYAGECPGYGGCLEDGCNCLDFCGFDDRCCHTTEYTCAHPPHYAGDCPNYYNCHSS